MNVKEKSHKIIIAASGSGGHLIPALAICEALKQQAESNGTTVDFLFIGSGRKLEQKLIVDNGYNLKVFPITGINRKGLKGLIKWLFRMPIVFLGILKTYMEYKPTAIIGVGGYVSVLPVTVGKIIGIKSLIHEAEKSAGLANKFLSKFATVITCAHQDCELISSNKKKAIHTGQPLAAKFREVDFVKTDSDAQSLTLNLTVLGGSLGANALDKGVLELAELFPENSISIKHQSRGENVELLTEGYEKLGINYEVLPFVENIVSWYQWSDVIIARAGANTVEEIIHTGRPAILVPLPNAPEQRHNAERILANKITVDGFAHQLGFVVNEGVNFVEELKYCFTKLIESVKSVNPSLRTDKSDQNQKDAALEIANRVLNL